MADHDHLLQITKKLPTDWKPWGEVDRDSPDNGFDGDCSCCLHAVALEDPFGGDWVVCANQGSPRAGLMTFEHQAGHGCYVGMPDYECPECGGDLDMVRRQHGAPLWECWDCKKGFDEVAVALVGNDG